MIIYGTHACKHVIKNRPQHIQRIFTVQKKPNPIVTGDLHYSLLQKVVYLSESDFAKHVSHSAIHQNIAIKIDNKRYQTIECLVDEDQNSTIAILDGVVDPQNFGTIMRNAAAMKVSHIIVQSKTSCPVTPAAVKIASGGYEYVEIITVVNIVNAIKQIKLYGYWVVAFDEAGGKNIFDLNLTGKICLVFGAEGNGIRKLVLDNSDFISKIPTSDIFPTLNVSASVAIAFYEAMRQKYV